MTRYAISRITLVVALLSLVCLPGCGKSPEARAAGTYELDKQAMKDAVQAEIDQIEDPMERMGASMMMGMFDMFSVTITLNADGTASGISEMAGESEYVSGTWTLTDNRISLTLAEEGEEPETMTGILDGDTIRIETPDEEEMPFDMIFRRVSS